MLLHLILAQIFLLEQVVVVGRWGQVEEEEEDLEGWHGILTSVKQLDEEAEQVVVVDRWGQAEEEDLED